MSRSIRHHLHLHTAGPPPPLALFSARPLISILPLSLSLSICLVNMCKQTSRGIDKTHPGVFISASSGQNMTPPPLKMISSVVFFPKRDLGDRLLPPSRVHSLYLVSVPFFPSAPSFLSSLHLSHSSVSSLPSFSLSTLLFPSASPPPLVFSHLFRPPVIFCLISFTSFQHFSFSSHLPHFHAFVFPSKTTSSSLFLWFHSLPASSNLSFFILHLRILCPTFSFIPSFPSSLPFLTLHSSLFHLHFTSSTHLPVYVPSLCLFLPHLLS